MSGELLTVGKSLAPVYGIEKATGELRFPADINLPNMLWMKIARSPHAHARIVRVNVALARKIPGVVAILTHDDVPKVLFGPYQEELYALDQEVRFVGDTVAAVAAEDWNSADAAARAIEVEYELLAPVFDAETAVGPRSPLAVAFMPEGGILARPGGGRPATAIDASSNVLRGDANQPTVLNARGDVDAGFLQSDVIVERVFRQSHVSAVAHEPRACVAVYRNGQCTLWCSVQDPYRLQESVAAVLGLPTDSVRVVSTNLGGAFGVKVTGRFAVLAALMARQTGRPVKVWFTREEESLDSHNRSALTHYVKAGAKKDGSLTAFEVRTFLDNGFWIGLGENIAQAICTRPMDLYHGCPNVKWQVFVVRTNHPTTGPYRGRADAESHFPVESVLDELAHAIQMDPMEFRLKNRLHEGDDLCSAPGKIVSTVWLEEAARSGAKAIGWERRSSIPAATPGPRKKGIGMALVIHSCGSNPAGTSAAEVVIDLDGMISLFSGTPDQGSEQQTTLRQMVAEIFAVALGEVHGGNADTSTCPYDSGPFSSRTVYATGIAASRAAEQAKKQLLEQAAILLKRDSSDLAMGNGSVWVRSEPLRKIALGEIVKYAGGSIIGKGIHNAKDDSLFAYGFAAAFAEVEVDVETGAVKILRLVSSHDVGRAINPMILEGQILGGAAQGVGYALTEGFHFDPRTGTALNQWFLDLRTPSILDLPNIEPVVVEFGEPTHPFGAKGCSEISYVGVAPAIANAIYNAAGIRLTELPMTPDRVLKALAEAKRSAA